MYLLALPPQFSAMHDEFHVSQFRKYIRDPAHVIHHEEIDTDVEADGSVIEEPVAIFDWSEKLLRGKSIPPVCVRWQRGHFRSEMWELESEMRAQWPSLSQTEGC